MQSLTMIETGTRFGRYRIQALLGAGGMGEVYLAQDTTLHRPVAIKLLPSDCTQNQERVARFEREAHAASSLNHPNILTIYEIGAEGDLHFIAAEFVDGESLRARLNRSRLALGEALNVASQIALALTAAHEARIMHRDIKPENIMLRADGIVKVLDFGLAKLAKETHALKTDEEAETRPLVKTNPGTVLGTAAYMSPEQARAREVDARTDIWSLGVVLYEMVAGRLPFMGETSSDMVASILRDEPPPLKRFSSEAPAELERIVARSLRKKGDERYQTIKDLALDLRNLKARLEFEAELERSLPPEEATARKEASSSGGEQQQQPSERATLLFDSASLVSRSTAPNNLTGQLSPLIGREREVAEIKKLLRRDGVRLITLTGVGGTGKTRLAQRVAREMLAEFADGVFFVELAAINDPQLVVSGVAQALGIKEAGGRTLTDNLKNYLRERALLLVLDNFEQVLSAAPLIAELLASSPKLKVMVTSRALLHLSAEREFAVPPLDLPASGTQSAADELMEYAAIALFVERARAVRSSFALTDQNALTVVEVCARLDGLPLAIELAAARAKLLSSQAILTRLENSLKLLTGGARDLPARQQTMRGAVAWSYDLLDEDEKRLFERLAVFAGGMTLEAAEAVCGEQGLGAGGQGLGKKGDVFPPTPDPQPLSPILDVLDGIGSLVDKSLLVQKEQAGGESRFRMLEVVREYALECLRASGEWDATGRLHAGFFLALAEEAEPELRGARQAEWLDRLEQEHDNLRAALQWSAERDAETTLRLAGALRVFWSIHGHLTEGRRWLESALERSDDVATSARWKALHGAGQMALLQGAYQSARKFAEQSLSVGRELGDRRQIALSSIGLGTVVQHQGDHAAARKIFEESLAIGRELGDKRVIAFSLNYLGEAARTEGDYAAARPLYEEALALYRPTGNKEAVSVNLNNLGAVAYQEGDLEAARSHYVEALTLAQELGNKVGISWTLDGLAALALKLGEPVRAARLAGAADAQRESIGYELETADRLFRDAYVSETRASLGEQAFAAAVTAGRALPTGEAIALALEIT